MKKTIGIDFDGTICKKQPYGDGTIYETPKDDAIRIVNGLAKEYNIVIFTVRLHPKFGGDMELKKQRIVNWFTLHGIHFDEITNNKPEAMLYIDDRAIRFTSWENIGNYLLQ